MDIKELTQSQCRDVLTRASFGRLACCLDDQPYIVPLYFAYEDGYVYTIASPGKKIEWMRKNPKVCLEVDNVADENRWVSVIVQGTYQELVEPQYSEERDHARALLSRRSHWWLMALGERQLRSGDQLVDPLFFRVKVETMTGLGSGDAAI